MVKELDKVDVVTIGAGWTGGIVAAETSKEGLKVKSLERGGYRDTNDYQHVHDELKYAQRYELMQDTSIETLTFRNSRDERALPVRRLGSFLPGSGRGGAGTHWNGQTDRYMAYDFEIKSMTEERYGKEKLAEDSGLRYRDWGITFDEMEKYYDKFEKTAGVSGEENPLGEKRSSPYPNPPMIKTKTLKMFEKAAQELDLHPIMMPSSNMSQSYENPDGETLNPCQYCAFCERFACEYDAKATPDVTVLKTAEKTGNYEIRYHSNVTEIVTDENDDKKVTGVKFIDTETREEFFQPADVVVLTSFLFNNYKLLRVSDIGEQYNPETEKGTLGSNYCYQTGLGATGFFDEQFNTFMGAGALGMIADDYNGDNFDHEDLDFIHGGSIHFVQTGSRPILTNTTRKDTPAWGEEFKKESINNFTRTLEVYTMAHTGPHRDHYLDLDETYKDAFGNPQVMLTYNWTEQDNAKNKYLTEKCAEIVEQMGAKHIDVDNDDLGNYDIVPYQSTNISGGTPMGTDPENSVVNTWLQHWDRDNLFVAGSSTFVHNSGNNPTGTVGAIAYRCAEGVIKYHKDNQRLED